MSDFILKSVGVKQSCSTDM